MGLHGKNSLFREVFRAFHVIFFTHYVIILNLTKSIL